MGGNVNYLSVFAIWILLATSDLFGETYYVATTGSNSNSGLSIDSPWPLFYALTNCGSSNTIIVMDGSYTTDQPNGFQLSRFSYVTVKAMNKWKAVICNNTNNGLTASDYNGAGGIYLTHHITFDGFCVSNNVGDGMGIGHDSIIRNCWVVGNGQGYQTQGIGMTGLPCSNNIVEYNLIENNGRFGGTTNIFNHGIYFGNQNNIIRGNVVRGNGAMGISVFTGYSGDWVNGNRIYNNLIYGQTNHWGLAVWGAVGQGPDMDSLPGTNYVYGNTILDGFIVYRGTVCVTNNTIFPNANYHNTQPIYNNNDYPGTVLNGYNILGASGPSPLVTSVQSKVPGSTNSLQVGITNTSGNCIVVAIQSQVNESASVSDILGNTYTLAAANTNSYMTAIYFATNCAGGSNWITASMIRSASSQAILAAEFSGVSLSAPLDGVSSTTGVGGTSPATITSGTITTTGNRDLILGMIDVDRASTVSFPNDPFLPALTTDTEWAALYWTVQNTAGPITYSVVDTNASSDPYQISIVALRRDNIATDLSHDIYTLNPGNVGFVNTNNGLYWLRSDSMARGNALSNACGPVDFFGRAQSSVADIGAFQYSENLLGDSRVFDPSPWFGAGYWQMLSIANIGTVNVGTLRSASQ